MEKTPIKKVPPGICYLHMGPQGPKIAETQEATQHNAAPAACLLRMLTLKPIRGKNVHTHTHTHMSNKKKGHASLET